MADEIIFVMHRRVVVRPAAVTGTMGYRYRTGMGDALDSPTAFDVREATDDEAMEAKQNLKDDVDARIDELLFKAAVDRRVAELRRQQAKG